MTTRRAARRARPASVYLLMALLLLLAVNALAGGLALIADPSGALMGMPVSLLHGSPFPDYLIPGFVLFGVLGALPLVVLWALWSMPGWGAMRGLEHLSQTHWALGAAFGTGAALVIWILVQMTILSFFLQPILLGLGLAIMAASLLPTVRRHYARP